MPRYCDVVHIRICPARLPASTMPSLHYLASEHSMRGLCLSMAGWMDAQEMARLLERHPGRKCTRDDCAGPGLRRPGVARLVCAHDAGDAVVAEMPVLRLRQSGWRPAEWKLPQTLLLLSLAWLTQSHLHARRKS